MRRRSTIAGSLLAAVLLAACQPAATPTPTETVTPSVAPTTASPTPTPTPTPTESANLAAARAALTKYLETKDRLMSDPSVPAQETENVAIGQASVALGNSIDQIRSAKARMAGAMAYSDIVVPEPRSVGGVLETVASFCADSTNADFVDESGKPAGEGRHRTYENQLTITKQPNGIWLVSYAQNQRVPAC